MSFPPTKTGEAMQDAENRTKQSFDSFFRSFLDQQNPVQEIDAEDFGYPDYFHSRHQTQQQRWTRQALVLSVFGVGLVVLAGCLVVAYLPGDRAEMARLKVQLDQQTKRAGELQATVEEQNKLLQAYSKRNEELNNSHYDAQQDIKEVREFMNDRFSEYGEAPHE